MFYQITVTAMKDRKKNGPKVTDMKQTDTHAYRRLGIGGRTIYRTRCRELLERGDLYLCDLTELYHYAKSCELFLRFDKQLSEAGDFLTYIDRMGNERLYPHPAIKACRDALADIQSIGAHFGFTPWSRKRLEAEMVETEDPVDALMKMVTNDRSRTRKNS